MRNAFIQTLSALAADDERIWLLTGDLGYSVLEAYYERFPQRYVNVGVAEQNLTGLAAGLASCGKIVFTYSIANFPTLRCLEQIRNDVCYHGLPDATKARTLLDFVWWATHDGQRYNEALAYARLPARVVRLEEERLKSITVDGRPVLPRNYRGR